MNYRSLDASALGIDLSTRNETQTFRWLLACLLFGHPIQQQIAKKAYRLLIEAGIISLDKLIKTDWDRLVSILDKAHYVRYDFSTATKLLRIAHDVMRQYGSVTGMIKRSPNADVLEQNLLSFNGIGPVTVRIFMDSLAPVWYGYAIGRDYDLTLQAADILRRHGFDSYIVGGAIRDLWLGLLPEDFDIVTNATPDDINKMKEFRASRPADIARRYGVSRVVLKPDTGKELEIATLRRDENVTDGRRATRVVWSDLVDDAMRRDLTINALVLDPSTDQVIDYVDGINDLRLHRIRLIGDPDQSLQADPLRLMRAIRFKNKLGFHYDQLTGQAIARAVGNGALRHIASEHLIRELTLILQDESRATALMDLDRFGILGKLMPEVEAMKLVEQPPELHAETNVWRHTLQVLKHLSPKPDSCLVWSALLHDIGKVNSPHKHYRKPTHESVFPDHYAIGAVKAEKLLKRLNFSNRDIKDIVWVIHNHIAIENLPAMVKSQQIKLMSHPRFNELLELYRADVSSGWQMPRSTINDQSLRDIERLWYDYSSTDHTKSLKKDLNIDRSWLIEHFGIEFDLTSRVLVDKTLQYLMDYYQDSGISDVEQYKAMARYFLLTNQSGGLHSTEDNLDCQPVTTRLHLRDNLCH